MKEVTLKIGVPEDLVREFERISKEDISLVLNRLLKEKILKLIKLERIISKSELSEEKAFKLAKEVNEGLYKRYRELYEERFS
jgi:hypothetical protein